MTSLTELERDIISERAKARERNAGRSKVEIMCEDSDCVVQSFCVRSEVKTFRRKATAAGLKR
jgi:hypothetical protein